MCSPAFSVSLLLSSLGRRRVCVAVQERRERERGFLGTPAFRCLFYSEVGEGVDHHKYCLSGLAIASFFFFFGLCVEGFFEVVGCFFFFPSVCRRTHFFRGLGAASCCLLLKRGAA